MSVRLPTPPERYDVRDQTEMRRTLEAHLLRTDAPPFREYGLTPRALRESLETGDNNMVLAAEFGIAPGYTLGITEGSTVIILT